MYVRICIDIFIIPEMYVTRFVYLPIQQKFALN